MIRPLRAHTLPLLALALVAVAPFARLVARPGALIVDAERPGRDPARPPDDREPGNDLTRLFLPLHARIAASLARTGHLPRWDPLGFGGRPLVGNPQAGLWYPPVWIAWASRAPAALGWLTVAHLLWGGLGAYGLALRLRLSRCAAFCGGACFAINPYVLGHVFQGHAPHVWAVAWYPWAALAVRGARPGWAMPAVLAMAASTGHPQEAAYLVLALLAWATWQVVRTCARGDPRGAAVTAGSWGIALVATAALLAIEAVPAALAHRWTLGGPGPAATGPARYRVSALNLFQLLSPTALGGPADYFGPGNAWEAQLGVGLVPLVLATLALSRSPRRGLVRGWGTLVIVAALFAAGPALGLSTLVGAGVPGMGRFRVPARSLFLAQLGVAVLAALGVEAVARGRPDGEATRRVLLRLTLACLAFAAAGWASCLRFGAAPEAPGPGHVATWKRLAWAGDRLARDPVFPVALGGTATAFAWLARRPGDRRRVAAALGGLAVAELVAHGLVLIRVAAPGRFLDPGPLAAALARARPPGPCRVRARDASFGDLWAVALGMEKTNVHDAFQIRLAADLYEPLYTMFDGPGTYQPPDPKAAALRRAILDRMAVGLVLGDVPDADFDGPIAAEVASHGRRYTIRGNPTALPRAYVVPRAEVAPDDRSTVARFLAVPGREAVLMPSDPLSARGPRQPFTPASYEQPEPDRVVIGVTTTAPGLLVVADTWMPGWEATLDGRPVPILRGNRAQRVVPLPRPGRHLVAMRYRAPGLAAGAAISSAAWLSWLAGVLLHRRFDTRPRRVLVFPRPHALRRARRVSS